MLLTRQLILEILAKNQPCTFDDFADGNNLGFIPDKKQLTYLLTQLLQSGKIKMHAGKGPYTYSMVEKHSLL